MSDIKVEYDGKYPNLCAGVLVVTISAKKWTFNKHALCSNGRVWFDDDWGDHVVEGPWSINEWPEGFPNDMRIAVLEAVNNEVEHGCCGGCI